MQSLQSSPAVPWIRHPSLLAHSKLARAVLHSMRALSATLDATSIPLCQPSAKNHAPALHQFRLHMLVLLMVLLQLT